MAYTRRLNANDIDVVSELVANFRIELSKLKDIYREPDKVSGKEELEDYIKSNFPIFVSVDEDKTITGYIVCKIDGNVIWAESLYVLPQYRRRGTASLLYGEAERIAQDIGCDTVYNWVHPNNDRIINFLKKRGYDVLNLIEIRKPWKGEQTKQKVSVDGYQFNY